MRTPTFTFVPFRIAQAEKVANRKKGFTVNVKYGYIVFPKEYVRDNALDGGYIKWFLDTENNALGWKILKDASGLNALKDVVQIKLSKSTKSYRIGISALLKMFNFSKSILGFKDLEVHTYLSKQEFFNDGTLHYLSLKPSSAYKVKKLNSENEIAH